MNAPVRYVGDDDALIETHLHWDPPQYRTYVARPAPRWNSASPAPPLSSRFKPGFIAGVAMTPLLLIASHLAPAAWLVPDRIAAFTLAAGRWEGGERMMANADPERWRVLGEGAALVALKTARNAACRDARRPSHETDRACASTIDPADLPRTAYAPPRATAALRASLPRRIANGFERLNTALEQ